MHVRKNDGTVTTKQIIYPLSPGEIEGKYRPSPFKREFFFSVNFSPFRPLEVVVIGYGLPSP